MRVTRFLMLFVAVAMTAGGCAQQRVVRVQMVAAPPAQAPTQGIDNVIYGSPTAYGGSPSYRVAAAPGYGAPAQPYAPAYGPIAAPAYPTPAPYPTVAAPTYAAPAYAPPPSYRMVAAPAPQPYVGAYSGLTMSAMPAYAPPTQQAPYTLDSGDRLRVVVFGQDGLTNSYVLDASGHIDMPLIGSVAAGGLTTDQLSTRIADLLRQGFIREPHVAVEVEAYRPFFILGEVTQPGQYPYVANMTAETAVAIAGGFGPRGYRKTVTISRNYGGQAYRFQAPITTPLRPGDTIQVQERWF
jgi:polysaccharide export outer membrane protein